MQHPRRRAQDSADAQPASLTAKSAQQVKNVSIDDLLGRTQVCTDNSAMADKVRGKTVLVTGGGGSIGSELCRQIAALKPGRLVIFDIYENNAYDIQMELRRRYPSLTLWC